MKITEEGLTVSSQGLLRVVGMAKKIEEVRDPVVVEKIRQTGLHGDSLTLDDIFKDTPDEDLIRSLTAEQRTLADSMLRGYNEYRAMTRVLVQGGMALNWDVQAAIGAFRDLAMIGGDEVANYANFVLYALGSEMIKTSQATDKTAAERFNDEGNQLILKRQYKSAIEKLDKAIANSAKYALAWVNKGIAWKNIAQATRDYATLERAFNCYDHVLTVIDPNYKKAWANKANALNHLAGDSRAALACVTRALEIDPDYAYAQKVRSEIPH